MRKYYQCFVMIGLLSSLLSLSAFTYQESGQAVVYDEIHAENGQVKFQDSTSGKSAVHPVYENAICILMDEDQELRVCFYEKADDYKAYTLGKQDQLQVSGYLDSLTVLNSEKAKSGMNIRVASSCEIGTLTAGSIGKVELYGKTDVLNVVSGDQAVSILGEVGTLNAKAAKEIAIEKKAQIGRRNMLSDSIRVIEMSLVV